MRQVPIALVMLTLSLPSTALAQNRTQGGYQCWDGHPMFYVRCSGAADCQAKEAAHNRECHAGPGGCKLAEQKKMNSVTAMATAGAAGYGLGYGITSANGTRMHTVGMYSAIALAATTRIAFSARTEPKVSTVIMGTIAGASSGAAYAHYQYAQGKPDTTPKSAAIGAGAGAAVGFLASFSRKKFADDTPSEPLPPAVPYVAALAVGAGAGAAAGQAWKTPSGEPQTMTAALGGAATLSTVTLLAKGHRMSPALATFAGALSGAAGGAAYGKWDADRGNDDRTAMYAGIGTGAGAGIGFLLSKAGGGSRPQLAPPVARPRRSTNVLITGRYVGAAVRW